MDDDVVVTLFFIMDLFEMRHVNLGTLFLIILISTPSLIHTPPTEFLEFQSSQQFKCITVMFSLSLKTEKLHALDWETATEGKTPYFIHLIFPSLETKPSLNQIFEFEIDRDASQTSCPAYLDSKRYETTFTDCREECSANCDNLYDVEVHRGSSLGDEDVALAGDTQLIGSEIVFQKGAVRIESRILCSCECEIFVPSSVGAVGERCLESKTATNHQIFRCFLF
jgi:hypothetical protein